MVGPTLTNDKVLGDPTIRASRTIPSAHYISKYDEIGLGAFEVDSDSGAAIFRVCRSSRGGDRAAISFHYIDILWIRHVNLLLGRGSDEGMRRENWVHTTTTGSESSIGKSLEIC